MKTLFGRLRLIDIEPTEDLLGSICELAPDLCADEETKGQQYEHLYDVVVVPELKSLLSSLHGSLWSFCNILRLFERDGRGQAYLDECRSAFVRLVEASRHLCESVCTDGLAVEIDGTWEEIFSLFGDDDAFTEAVYRMPLDDFKSRQIFHVVRHAMVEGGCGWHTLRLNG